MVLDAGVQAADVEMITSTLTTILDFVSAPNVIEYLSLDVEEAETHVLRGRYHCSN
jgi:hypothetical protein